MDEEGPREHARRRNDCLPATDPHGHELHVVFSSSIFFSSLAGSAYPVCCARRPIASATKRIAASAESTGTPPSARLRSTAARLRPMPVSIASTSPSSISADKAAARTLRRSCYRNHAATATEEYSSADSYKKACRKALEKHASGQKWDLALRSDRGRISSSTSRAQSLFHRQNEFSYAPDTVQEFEIETTQKWGSQLSCCLNNMGLATFAKLNGIPWLLKANSPKTHELIIGLGSAEVGEGVWGNVSGS